MSNNEIPTLEIGMRVEAGMIGWTQIRGVVTGWRPHQLASAGYGPIVCVRVDADFGMRLPSGKYTNYYAGQLREEMLEGTYPEGKRHAYKQAWNLTSPEAGITKPSHPEDDEE